MQSTSTHTYQVYTDGASRGNPGKAASAFIINHQDQIFAQKSAYLGTSTNNIAEYTALLNAWEYISQHLTSEVILHFFSDSELMVNQLNKIYRVKDTKLKEIYDRINTYSRPYISVTYSHIPRSQNKLADKMCNDLLDQTI